MGCQQRHTCTTALNKALSLAVKAAVAVPPTAPTPSGTIPLKDESCKGNRPDALASLPSLPFLRE